MKPKLLFVDDDHAWMDALTAVLSHEGYEVIGKTNTSEALTAIRTIPDIAVALIDLMLPRESTGQVEDKAGLELLEEIRSKRGSMPVLIVSAFLEPSTAALTTLGVSGLIHKGDRDSVDNLLKHLREVLGDGEPGRGEPLSASSAINVRNLILDEINRYSPIKERTIIIPNERQYELIKPLIGFRRDIENQIVRYPFTSNVFLMMKFRSRNRELGEYIIERLANHALRGVRADSPEWNITRNAYNPIAVLYCCKYGIALFDEPEQHQAYSPNVAYELGMMHYQNKDCLILRHSSLPSVPFDLVKDLYITYDRDLQVRQFIDGWITHVFGVTRK